MKNFSDQLDEFYFRRMEGIETSDFPVEYQRGVSKGSKLFDEIKECLPADKKELINEFEMVNSTIGCIDRELTYKLGFSDAFKMFVKALTWEPSN